MSQIVFRERSYVGYTTYALGDFKEVIKALLNSKITPKGIITKVIKIDKVIEEGFYTLIND
ncbi:hypothetical protein DER46DRAFT_665652 [Fusarium sp. MPI-SDFR-AT-0072]|nr:hypothetical protein DER46DRAFT_665652 [Fusarium sp. MPI-SDFR-AT-0072]